MLGPVTCWEKSIFKKKIFASLSKVWCWNNTAFCLFACLLARAEIYCNNSDQQIDFAIQFEGGDLIKFPLNQNFIQSYDIAVVLRALLQGASFGNIVIHIYQRMSYWIQGQKFRFLSFKKEARSKEQGLVTLNYFRLRCCILIILNSLF